MASHISPSRETRRGHGRPAPPPSRPHQERSDHLAIPQWPPLPDPDITAVPSASMRTLEERKILADNLQKIIQTEYGMEFSVQVTGLAQFGVPLERYPPEFIVTTSINPEPRDGKHLKPLPDAYLPTKLAALLARKGEAGIFAPNPDSALTDEPSKPWHEDTAESSESYPLYPRPLVVGGPHGFTLLPASPAHRYLEWFIEAYTKVCPALPSAITAVQAWMLLHRVEGFTPTCIALMLIYRIMGMKLDLRGEPYVPSNPVETRHEIILPLGRNLDKYVMANTSIPEAQHHVSRLSISPPIGLKGLLLAFYRYWGSAARILGTQRHIISIRHSLYGMETSRAVPFNYVFSGDTDPATCSWGKRGLEGQPSAWSMQPVIIQDPIIHSYNHAAGVSPGMFDVFRALCSHGNEALAKGTFFHQAFENSGAPVQQSVEPVPDPVVVPKVELTLNDELVEFYERSRPQPEVLEKRAAIIRRVQSALRSTCGPGFRVENFGSAVYGVDTATSDLDMVIIDSARPRGFHPSVKLSELPSVYNIHSLARTVTKAGFLGIEKVPWASVPIVKFRDRSGLECDLNVNDQLGSINTRMIAHYCDLVPNLRPLIFAVKKWAKSHGYNNPSGHQGPATFSSYCLSLMTIGFLQSRGLAPNLQEGLEDESRAKSHEVFWLREQKSNKRIPCYHAFHEPETWSPPEQVTAPSLRDIFLDWLRFYGSGHRYGDDVISVRLNGVVPRSRNVKQRQNDGIKALPAESTAQAAARDHVEEDQSTFHPTLAEERLTPEQEDAVFFGGGEEDKENPEAQVNTRIEEMALEQMPVPAVTREHTGLDPADWTKAPLVVADPFIRAKNCARAVIERVIHSFQEQCTQSARDIEAGNGWDDLLGDNSGLPKRKRQRQRGPKPPRPGKGAGRNDKETAPARRQPFALPPASQPAFESQPASPAP